MEEYRNTKITIVEFQPKYAEQIKDLIGSILKALDVIPQDSDFDDEDLDHIEKLYIGNARFWVAVDDHDHVIGTVAVGNEHGKTIKLRRMFVRESYRGTGVGQKLFDHAKAFAKHRGFTELLLDTHCNMTRAHHFYEKNGFVRTGQTGDSYQYMLALQDR